MLPFTITFKFTRVPHDVALQQLVTEKFASLKKFIGTETAVICEVEFEKTTQSHTGAIFRVEANLTLRGVLYRAEAMENNFELAITTVRHELEQELRRAHDKRDSLIKKEAVEHLKT